MDNYKKIYNDIDSSFGRHLFGLVNGKNSKNEKMENVWCIFAGTRMTPNSGKIKIVKYFSNTRFVTVAQNKQNPTTIERNLCKILCTWAIEPQNNATKEFEVVSRLGKFLSFI